MIILLLLPIIGLPVSPRLQGSPENSSSATSLGPTWTPQQKEAQRAAGKQVIADLHAAIGRRARKFVIPPGDYRFDSPGGDDFVLQDLTDFGIDAAGVTFWFSPKLGLRIRHCNRVTIRDLTIDTDPLPWLQGRISAIDPQAKTMDFVIEDGYRTPTPDELSLRRRVLFFDPNTAHEIFVPDERVTELSLLHGNLVRISRFAKNAAFTAPVFPRQPRVGDRIVINDERWNGGNVFLQDCTSNLLDHITVFASANFAFHEEGGEGGNIYRQCRLIRRPNTDRLMASRGDGFHSTLMKHGPIIENCELSSAGDDLLAIQGFFGVIVARESAHTFLVASPFGQNIEASSPLFGYSLPNGNALASAETIAVTEVRDAASLQATNNLRHRLLEIKGVRIRPLTKLTVCLVVLNRSVPWSPLDVVASDSYVGAGAIIRNNYLHDGHIRGILVKSHNTLVQNNVIQRIAHGGIVFESELYWLEGPFNSDAKIVDNRVEDVGWGAFDQKGVSVTLAAITVGNYFGDRIVPRVLTTGTQNHDIQIVNNQIVHPAAFPIWVRNSRNVVITGNNIDAPFAAGNLAQILDLSKLLAAHLTADPASMNILREPYFSILLQNVKNYNVVDNHVKSPPAFYKGTLGSARLSRKI
jgi:hypothetical protein